MTEDKGPAPAPTETKGKTSRSRTEPITQGIWPSSLDPSTQALPLPSVGRIKPLAAIAKASSESCLFGPFYTPPLRSGTCCIASPPPLCAESLLISAPLCHVTYSLHIPPANRHQVPSTQSPPLLLSLGPCIHYSPLSIRSFHRLPLLLWASFSERLNRAGQKFSIKNQNQTKHTKHNHTTTTHTHTHTPNTKTKFFTKCPWKM